MVLIHQAVSLYIRSLLQNGKERCCGSKHYNPAYDICCQDNGNTGVYKKSDVSSDLCCITIWNHNPLLVSYTHEHRNTGVICVCGCDIIYASRCNFVDCIPRRSEWNIIVRKNIVGHCNLLRRSVHIYIIYDSLL